MDYGGWSSSRAPSSNVISPKRTSRPWLRWSMPFHRNSMAEACSTERGRQAEFPRTGSYPCSADRRPPRSGDRPWIERCERILQAPVFGPRLFPPAGHVQDKAKDLVAYVLNAGVPRRDTPRIDVDQIAPLLGQRGARRHFDYRDQRQPVRAALSGGEHVHVHGGELLS